MFRVPFLAQGIDTSARDGLLAAGARRTHLLIIVSFAVGHAFVFEKGASKGASAELAVEVFWVPLSTEGVDTIAENGLIARTASWGKNLMEALIAVGSSVTFEKVAFERRGALGAHETVNVPFFVERRHATIRDGLVAVCAFRAELNLITTLAVRLTGQLEEGARTQGVVTRATHEVFWVISAAQCLHALIINRLTTMIAHTTRTRTAAARQIIHIGRDRRHQIFKA